MIRWLLYFIPALLIEGFCWLTNPIACLFVYKKPRTDKAKRLGTGLHTFPREYLRGLFYLWATHDNAVDEGWYGAYEIPFLKNANQLDYDSSALIRYWCRLWWLSRNTAYGWHYLLFSRPKETMLKEYEYGVEYPGFWYRLRIFKSSWQLEAHIPIPFLKRYLNINIGWKQHKEKPRLLYANRIIGLRKY